MMPPHMHSHEVTDVLTSEANTEHDHNMNMWKGLTAMIGLIIFFFTEKALAMIAEWRKHRQRKNKVSLLSNCHQLFFFICALYVFAACVP